MDDFVYYEAQHNSDQTEGKGRMVSFARYVNERLAVEAVKGEGVMGVGDGEVVKVILNVEGDEVVETRQRIYGYRRDWRGQWGSGYIDNRDAPVQDPEYKEYLRLKAKFGG